MLKKQLILITMMAGLFLLDSCSKEGAIKPIVPLSIKLNGTTLIDNAENVSIDASVEIVFSSALNPTDFESQFSVPPLSTSNITNITYSNQSSRVTIDLNLEYFTNYILNIGNGPIGKNGEHLDKELSISFSTRKDETIYEMDPCTSGSADCLQSVSLTSGNGTGNFQFYSSFPIYEEMAEWQKITSALIVVHGLSRNPDDYFNYMMTILQAENLENNVVLIAPFFKNETEAATDDFYWANNDWRSGQNSVSAAKISSFEVIDKIIEQLADNEHFPAMTKIIVTGNSSGGLFTHLYAASNNVEQNYESLSFDYVVSESQYFYYPDGQRIDEATNQLYSPAGCAGYDIWPLGFNVVPPYLSTVNQSLLNEQFVSRSITYLIGNGSGTDGTLNTSDCYATLLGSSRYKRGENMFRYMELVYPDTHNHSKTIVGGVLHDGSGMYQSPEFHSLLLDLLGL